MFQNLHHISSYIFDCKHLFLPCFIILPHVHISSINYYCVVWYSIFQNLRHNSWYVFHCKHLFLSRFIILPNVQLCISLQLMITVSSDIPCFKIYATFHNCERAPPWITEISARSPYAATAPQHDSPAIAPPIACITFFTDYFASGYKTQLCFRDCLVRKICTLISFISFVDTF